MTPKEPSVGARPLSVDDASRVFDLLAPNYDRHFAVPHRAVYDELAWERTVALLTRPTSTIVDAGCGVGRWAERFVQLGHHVVGLEPAPAMAAAARVRAERLGTDRFRVVESDMATRSVVDPGSADLVIAMGSLQYVPDLHGSVANFWDWLRPGGRVAVLVDSLVALVLELVAAGKPAEALERARTRQGVWAPEGPSGPSAALHLLDRQRLTELFVGAGFGSVRTYGLLVSATALGGPELRRRLTEEGLDLELERSLGEREELADTGKQLLLTAVR